MQEQQLITELHLAGFDVIAVDSMCARLMGVPLEQVGYLNYCAAAGIGYTDRDKIEIIGSQDPDKSIIKYKMNQNIERQLEWMGPVNEETQSQRSRG